MQQMKAQQASFASLFSDGIGDDFDDDTAADGDESTSDTSGDKEEEEVRLGHALFARKT